MDNTVKNKATFIDHLNDFIKSNTEYTSANELINAKIKKPFFANGKIRKLRKNSIVKINYAIDYEDFLNFLNLNLGSLGCFGKWSPVTIKSPSVLRAAATGNNNQFWSEVPLGDPSLESKYDEMIFGAIAENRENILARIAITHEGLDPNNENRNIIFEVSPRILFSPCPKKYVLNVKFIPILQAATLYYINEYLPNKGK